MVNDHYGHDVGDEVIRAIADCMKETFRKNDIILRLGGDEFAAYAVGCTDESEAHMLMSQFIDAVDQINIPAMKGQHTVEVSIGASFFTTDSGKNFETLYKEADTAAYRSKKVAGSCITYYSSGLSSDSAQD